MDTSVHRTHPNRVSFQIDPLSTVVIRLEQLAEQLEVAIIRLERAEDALDRQRRPFGNGARPRACRQ